MNNGTAFTFPLVIMTAFGASGGAAAQHSDTPYPVFMNVGGLKIVCPSTPYDAKGLLKSAIRSDDPVMYFQHGGLGGTWGEIPEEEYFVPLDTADIKRIGTDVTVVAIGMMVHRALEAATVLESEGISVEVVDLRSLVPIDKDTILSSVQKTGSLVVVDEARLRCSAASEVAAMVAEEGFKYLKASPRRVAAPNVPIPYSPGLEKPRMKRLSTIACCAFKACYTRYICQGECPR